MMQGWSRLSSVLWFLARCYDITVFNANIPQGYDRVVGFLPTVAEFCPEVSASKWKSAADSDKLAATKLKRSPGSFTLAALSLFSVRSNGRLSSHYNVPLVVR